MWKPGAARDRAELVVKGLLTRRGDQRMLTRDAEGGIEVTSPSRARGAVAIVASFVLSLLPSSAALASHTANCSEYGYVNRQMGYLSDAWSNHRYGVRATFENQGLALCTNPRAGEGSASTAWVAIQGPGIYDIVQMGHGRCRPIAGGGCNSNMQDGYAWGRTSSSPGCSGFTSRAPTGSWLGGYSGGGVFSVVEEADHDYVLNSPDFGVWIQNASICWTNLEVAIFVESHDFGDALGGEAANTFRFTSKQFKTSAAGAWMALPNKCNARSPGLAGVFKCDATADGSLRTWTDR